MYFCSSLALMFVWNCVLSSATEDPNLKQCEDAFKNYGVRCCDLTYEVLQGGCQIRCRCDGNSSKIVNVKDMTPAGPGKMCVRGCRREIRISIYLNFYDCKNYVGVSGVKNNCTCELNPCAIELFEEKTGKYLGTSTCRSNGRLCREHGHRGTCKDGECVCEQEQTDDKKPQSSKSEKSNQKLKNKSDPETKKPSSDSDQGAPRQQPAQREDKQEPSSKSDQELKPDKSHPKSNTGGSDQKSNHDKISEKSSAGNVEGAPRIRPDGFSKRDALVSNEIMKNVRTMRENDMNKRSKFQIPA